MVTVPLPICIFCQHFDPTSWSCEAFPEGIPDVVKIDGNDHKNPLPGDHGIQLKAKDNDEARAATTCWNREDGGGRGRIGQVQAPRQIGVDVVAFRP